MSENERYPLWCVDQGESFGEERYLGPYDKRHHAAVAGLDESDIIRKCRRVLASELGFDADSDYGGIIASMDGLARDGDIVEGAWANFDDSIVQAKVSTTQAVAAFWAWADAHLEVIAFVCEGDEPGDSDDPSDHGWCDECQDAGAWACSRHGDGGAPS